jgi:chromosome segregation ATPase
LSSKLSAFRASPSFDDSTYAEAQSRISALEEGDSRQERRLAAIESKLSQLAQLEAELARMQVDLARVISEVQTTLPHLSREIERLQSGISWLQPLVADHVCLRDVEAMCQEATADVAALRSEVGSLERPMLKSLRSNYLKPRSLTPLTRIVTSHASTLFERRS